MANRYKTEQQQDGFLWAVYRSIAGAPWSIMANAHGEQNAADIVAGLELLDADRQRQRQEADRRRAGGAA